MGSCLSKQGVETTISQEMAVSVSTPTVTFVTGNPGKLKEVQLCLGEDFAKYIKNDPMDCYVNNTKSNNIFVLFVFLV